VAGQADSDGTDHTVRDVRRTPNRDNYGRLRMDSADVLGCREQFLRDQALAPLEVPALHAAAQLLADRGAKLSSCSISSKSVSSSLTAVGDSPAMLDM